MNYSRNGCLRKRQKKEVKEELLTQLGSMLKKLDSRSITFRKNAETAFIQELQKLTEGG